MPGRCSWGSCWGPLRWSGSIRRCIRSRCWCRSLFCVPVFDTLFVMYIRWLRGIPVFLGSSDHFALRLRHWRLSVPQVVVVSYGVALVLGGVALGMMVMSMKTALVLVGATMTLLVMAAVWLKRIDMSRPAQTMLRREPSPEPARRLP